MSRFGSTSLLNIDEAVENTVPVNTKRSKTCVWTQCTSFCKKKRYNFENCVSKEELAIILKDWAFNIRKKSGNKYKESVVKIMWNSTAKQLQEMYYRKFNMKFDPFTDIEFSSSRAARNAKRRDFQTNLTKKNTVLYL
jgi:hypothetical protein